MSYSILLIDDDKNIQKVISNFLETRSFIVKTVSTVNEAIKEVKTNTYDVALIDISLPDGDGIQCLKEIKKINEDIIAIVLTAYGETKRVVEAIKNGAYDYLVKPVSNEEILLTIEKSIKELKFKEELKYFKEKIENELRKSIVIENPVMKKIFQQAKELAKTNSNILLTGETGVGKEILAYWIHQNSNRNNGPYITIDCGALPKDVIEAELFGYEKGAFTDAQKRKLGRIELADGGTLFLDEICNLQLELQPKLLRVLEEKKFYRVGGTSMVEVDVRFIFASNEPLEELVEKSLFRKDLYYRIAEFKIEIPPLRERKEEIIPLANFFLQSANLELNKNVEGISEQAQKMLLDYHWPGNIRELRNVIKFATFLAKDKIEHEHIRYILSRSKTNSVEEIKPLKTLNIKHNIEELEKKLILSALQQTKNNKVVSAKLLGISRKSLYEKLKKFSLQI
ncbi:MAG: sigma-54 dependent transcriptional regulator [Endomicrobia bacterium]|nr:sigma-54 dependent transcriptional regulator [Endomicrobiia bacterium]MDW8056240.1 sigma-54 dependent transcriptional regulator [Elusimicrobiota bacterium]